MNHSDVGSVICENDNIICSTFTINREGDFQRTEKMIIKNPKPLSFTLAKKKDKEPIQCMFLIKIFSNLIEKQKEE